MDQVSFMVPDLLLKVANVAAFLVNSPSYNFE